MRRLASGGLVAILLTGCSPASSGIDPDTDAAADAGIDAVPPADAAIVQVSVTRAGSGYGTVRSSDERIVCGETCAAEYAAGTELTLTGAPGDGSRFVGFSGGCAGECAGPDWTFEVPAAATAVTGHFLYRARATISQDSASSANPAAIATDGDGNTVVVGSFRGQVDFGLGSFQPSSGGLDAFVARYAADGTPSWVKTFGGTGDDLATGVAVDGGGVFVTGSFGGSAVIGDAGCCTAQEGSKDAFFARLDAADGALAWVHSFGGPNADSGVAVARVGDRAIVAANAIGDAMKRVYLDGETTHWYEFTYAEPGVLVASFDAGTGEARWVKGQTAPGAQVHAMAVEAATGGAWLWLAASRESAAMFRSIDPPPLGTDHDISILRISESPASGEVLGSIAFGDESVMWDAARRTNQRWDDFPTGIALHRDDQGLKLYLTGHHDERREGFVSRYSVGSTLVLLANDRYDASWSTAHGLAVDASRGRLVVLGSFEGMLPGFQPENAQGPRDLFLASYDLSSFQVRKKLAYGGTAFDEGSAVTLDPEGNIVVAGVSRGEIEIEGAVATTTGTGGLLLYLDRSTME